MNKEFESRCKELEQNLVRAYEESTTMEEAEKLAAKFLHACMQVSDQLRITDLDSRMRKSGVKAIKASIYLDACSKADKKPTENALTAMIDSNEIVSGEQTRLDESESCRDYLKNYLDVFTNGHIFFRGIAKSNG